MPQLTVSAIWPFLFGLARTRYLVQYALIAHPLYLLRKTGSDSQSAFTTMGRTLASFVMHRARLPDWLVDMIEYCRFTSSFVLQFCNSGILSVLYICCHFCHTCAVHVRTHLPACKTNMARGARHRSNKPNRGARNSAARERSFKQSNNTFARLSVAEQDGEFPCLAKNFPHRQHVT
jgi:hypothetical protein